MSTDQNPVMPKFHRTPKDATECKCGNRGPICFAAWASCYECRKDLIGDETRAGLCAACAAPITRGLESSWICVGCKGRCSGGPPPLCFQCDPTHIYNLKPDCTPTDDAPKPIEFMSADQGNLQTRGKQVKEPAAEESNEQYLERIFQQEPYMAQQPGFREFLLESMDEIGARPRASECASMLRAWKAGYEFRGPLLDIGRTAWAVATGTESPRALPFIYSDDIGQIGEHDVFFGGVELTQDVGEFKAGTKFACAVIDFQAGHLTLEEHHGREHRYDFALKVGAKHEGHTCTGCGSVVGQPCRQHA